MSFFKKLFKRKPKNDKYTLGLHKTKESMGSLKEILASAKQIDENLFIALEDIFIQADIGIETVLFFMEELKNDVSSNKLSNPLDLQETIVDKMFELYLQGELVQTNLNYQENAVNIYLFVGVNGVGKTTSIGKLANQFRLEGKKVLLIAGDTFRAGAIEQLIEWSSRSQTDIFYAEAKTDPSSVIYEGLKKAQKEKFDIVLIDTAGRLQTKINLMNELEKITRVIERVAPNCHQETLLVVDATTGQNGLKQAETFKESTKVTGIILTKLDGTAKGGIVLAIRHLYGLPIKYIGVGEKIDDLIPFDIESYIYGLFSEFF